MNPNSISYIHISKLGGMAIPHVPQLLLSPIIIELLVIKAIIMRKLLSKTDKNFL
jgi:hypothetical protein